VLGGDLKLKLLSLIKKRDDFVIFLNHLFDKTTEKETPKRDFVIIRIKKLLISKIY